MGPAGRPSVAVAIRRTRLIAGLVVVFYLVGHLANHALGLDGLAAMNAGEHLFVAFWHGWVGTFLLYASLAVHFVLALWSIYERRQWRMAPHEAAQLIFGLVIPAFLVSHAVDTRFAHEFRNVEATYTHIIVLGWLHSDMGVSQALLLVLAWGHGCFGVHYWLRLKRWYGRWAPVLLAVAFALPILALLGFFEALREVAAQAQNPGWVEATLAQAGDPGGTVRESLQGTKHAIGGALALMLVLTLGARHLRNRFERRHRSIRASYPHGRSVVAPIGRTLLEISRFGAIPHASVCGGRGRCSTCRVRVVAGLEAQPPADATEIAVLKRVGAPADVRLACQLRPTDDLTVIPLLPAAATPRDAGAMPDYALGDEREICILFADLRGFTRFSERKLPYDVVFFLNQYFETMGDAIERAGGIANQFTGDGVMALFGLESGATQGCRDAIAAAKAMVQGLAAMSGELAAQLDEPLRMGIGIHCGPTVVGRMGRGVAMYLTAVGDTVHVASRLQDLTKQHQCQLVISESAAARAGVNVSAYPRHEIAVRNRAEAVTIRAIADVAALHLT